VSLVQIGIVTGILAAYCVGWLAVDAGPTNWRWMFGLGAIPAVALLAAGAALPESPRWLVGRGETQAARNVLAAIVGPRDADAELLAIANSMRHEAGGWSELRRPGIGKPLVVGLAVTILSVTVGINAVLLYGPAILIEGAGQSIPAALEAGVYLGCVNFAFSLVALVAIDRLGRKPLLVVGLAGMGIAMLAIGRQFQPGDGESSPALLVPILAFVAFYAASLGPASWVIASEIFPTKARGAGMALCMIIMYLADFAVTLVFPTMMLRLGSGAFWVFAGICAAGIAFVLAVVPETKGKSLEQIEALWSTEPLESRPAGDRAALKETPS
jgi:sugar porter (SP) family MFS transporter